MTVSTEPRRVVVTGAAGFLGAAVAAACLARGDQVVGIDLATTDPAPGPGRRWVSGDISRAGPWESALVGADLVVHTAAIVTEDGNRDRFDAVNVTGTRRVCAAAAAAGVRRVVHLSSIVVYGDRFTPGSLRRETDPVVPTGGPYTDTKIASEHAALAVAAEDGLAVTIVRPGDVIGPRSVPWVLRPLALLRSGRFVLVDGGRWPLSPIHVDDVVAGILRAADAEVAVGRTYNLAGPPVPAREVFAVHAQHTGVRMRSAPRTVARTGARVLTTAARLAGRPAPFTPAAIEYVTHPGGYDTRRAETELGWSLTVPWRAGLVASCAAADLATAAGVTGVGDRAAHRT